MKKQVLLFMITTLFLLMIVPAINFSLGSVKIKKEKNWLKNSGIYNLDFALPCISSLLYPLGISTDPKQVIIGKQGWLYLGDECDVPVVTVMRRGATAKDRETVQKIDDAAKAWSQNLKSRQISLFKILLAPDKETIYPEYLPDWMLPRSGSLTDVLLADVPPGLYIDTRQTLLAAKSQYKEPLYYKTDTHWNNLGAWVGYRAFAEEIARTEKELHWLTDRQVRILKSREGPGNDLANMLRMKKMLRDTDVPVEITTGLPVETVQYDFWTGRVIASGGNLPVLAPKRPLLVKSEHALNRRKVLWLRDSFGTLMTPYMAATFSEQLQINYTEMNPALFSLLIDKFKPDYVFITVAERNILNQWFLNPPSVTVAFERPKHFVVLGQGVYNSIYDAIKLKEEGTYKISGDDPQILFTLTKSVDPRDASLLVFNLDCDQKKEPVNIQFFWRGAGGIYSEANSIRLSAMPGAASVDLSTLPAWIRAGTITDVRVDFDPPFNCSLLTVDGIELGK